MPKFQSPWEVRRQNSQVASPSKCCPSALFPPSALPARLKAHLSRLIGLCLTYFLEPVGGSSPKFPAESSISNLGRQVSSSLALVCPAQGSPIPAFRSDGVLTSPSEPVGGSAPKFSALSKSSTLDMPQPLPFSLSCPAQGSPVPSYRLVLQVVYCRADRRIRSQVLGRTDNQRINQILQTPLQSLLSSTRVAYSIL